MLQLEEFGPDNPRAWSTDHPSLKRRGPYEPTAIVRAQQLGHRGQELMKLLKLRGSQLMQQLEQGLEEYRGAEAQRRKIHDAYMKVGQE